MKKRKEFTLSVCEALDSLVDGRGFGPKEAKILRAVDAVPKMLDILKRLSSRNYTSGKPVNTKEIDDLIEEVENG